MVIHFDRLDHGDDVCCDPGWTLKSGRVGHLEEGTPWVVEQGQGIWVDGRVFVDWTQRDQTDTFSFLLRSRHHVWTSKHPHK